MIIIKGQGVKLKEFKGGRISSLAVWEQKGPEGPLGSNDQDVKQRREQNRRLGRNVICRAYGLTTTGTGLF